MHEHQRRFIETVKAKHPAYFRNASVLELGSYNINGTVRDFFTDPKEYVGVDWRAGPDVDVVSLCHELDLDGGARFDVLISSEMLEHDPFWRESLAKGVEYLVPGGLVVLTCAAPARGMHEVDVAPDGKHYSGVSHHELAGEMLSLGVDGTGQSGWNGVDSYYSGIKA